MKIVIAIEPATATTAFGVAVPDLPGCFSAGDTYDQAISNVKESISLWYETVGCIPQLRTLEECRMDSEYAGWELIEVDVEGW